jgi:putative flippase GtrA
VNFSIQLFWFGISGVTGFIVDSGVLYLLKGSLGPYVARLVSFLCAAFSTWLFNRAITFRNRKSGHSTAREFGIYLALMMIGGSVNYGVYALLISRYAFIAHAPVYGVAAGSVAGMTINLLTSRFILYRFQQS